MNLAFTEVNEIVDISFRFDNRDLPDAYRLVGGHHKAEVVLLCMLLRLTLLNQLLTRLTRSTNKEGLETVDINHIYSLIPSVAATISSSSQTRPTGLVEALIRGDRKVLKHIATLVRQDYMQVIKGGLNADTNNMLFDQLLMRDSVQRYKGKVESVESDEIVTIIIDDPFYELQLYMRVERRTSEGGPVLRPGSEVQLWPTGNATPDLGQAAFRLVGLTTHLEKVENTSDANSVQ